MKLLQETFEQSQVILDLDATDMGAILHDTVQEMVRRGLLSSSLEEEVKRALTEREAQAPTAIGNSVSVPHTYLEGIERPMVVFVRLARPVNLGAPDGIPIRFLFLLLGPPGAAERHLDTLAGIARLTSEDEFRYDASQARSAADLARALKEFFRRTAPPARGREAEVPQSLQYSGRLFGGLINDLRRRLPYYVSDFRDGLHSKCIASVLFLFFACLAPAVTFGGIMSELTDGHIGAVEMILASAACGLAYALFSGQPLIILGGTGPLLIYTWLLYVLCQQVGLEGLFLESRAWVGLWTGLLLLILAVTDASCLVRYFTRFTDEIFAALISIIFIYAALEALLDVVREVYQEEKVSHDKALVPLLLAIGTFWVATSLSRFRRSRYLLSWMREFLADFGPAIALAVMTLVAAWWFHDVSVEMLSAPDSVRPTMDPAGPPRAWLVDPLAAPRWVWLASLGPAVLAAVLVYVDQNITARLVNSPDHKLQKGEAYHWDLALMGVVIAACSLFGLPWLVAATVRSLNHVRSLATLEEVVSKEGGTRERVLHVRETRLTGLAIHAMIGLSVLALPLLRLLPMSVLYGLFLYMGVVSIYGNQFFERLSLWVMDPALYPATHYIRRVPISTIHCFTVLQLACLAMLGIVELSPLGILFPLFVVLLVPVRFAAGKFFNSQHLAALDAAEEPEEEETQWV